MFAKGWFLEGHLDDEKTCLITSHGMYQQYNLSHEQYPVNQSFCSQDLCLLTEIAALPERSGYFWG